MLTVQFDSFTILPDEKPTPRLSPRETDPVTAPKGHHAICPGRAVLMSLSFAQMIVHLVLFTMNRDAWLPDDNRDDLHTYIVGFLMKNGSILNVV